MSYTEQDARWDEAWDKIFQEIYPEHKEQAIDEFTGERLRSFYLKHPNILIPGIKNFLEAERLLKKHPSASFVFSTTAIELFLKAALLKPIVYGLVHNETLAEVIVESALGQTGFDRYKKLMSKLFNELASIDINNLSRPKSKKPLLGEASEVQKTRNKIIHQGNNVTVEQAEFAHNVAATVFFDVVHKILHALGLKINDIQLVEVV